MYSDPEPVLEMDDDDPSVSQPLHVGGGGGMHGRGMTADQVEQYAAQAQAQAQHMHQAQAQQMHLTQPGRDPPGNGAHYGTPSRSNVAKGYGKHHHHHSAQDDVTATPTPSTMTDQTKTTATMSMSMSTAEGGGGGAGAEGMSMPPYRQHQPHPHLQQHRPQGSPQRRRPSHPQQPQLQQQHQHQQRSDQWPPQPYQEQQQEYFDQRPQQQTQETTTSTNRSKNSHIQWDEGVVRSPEKRGSVGGGGDGGRRGDGGGEDISTAASGHSQFRSRFFRAAAVAAHRDGKIQVDGATTADSGAGADASGGGPGTEPARQQVPVAPQSSSSSRAPVANAGNFHTPAPISPRNNINTSMATDAGVVHDAPRQMVERVGRADDSPAIAAPSPMRVPTRRAIDPEPSPSPQRRALQPPEQHHVTFQAPHNGPQSILRSPTRSPARTKSSSEAGASSLHQHMLNQNAIRRTGSYSTSGSTDKSSVARLVAKLNSVKRDDPASALAAIDAIIKSESFSVGGGSGTQNDDVEIENADEIGAATSEINEMKANLETTAEVMDKPANHAMQPISHDPPAAQPLFPDVPIGNQNAIAPNTSAPRTDEEEIKSLVGSSEDESDDEDGSFASTVSSITNPTYLGNFKARQGSDNGGLMIQQQYQHWQQQQQQQMAAPAQQSMNSGQNQGAGLPPLAPHVRPFPAIGSQPSHPVVASTPEASPGRMIMTPPKVTRTKADPSSADMPSSRDPTGQELISPVISPAGSFAATTPKSPGEESRTSPIARMRAAAEKQDKRQQSRDNVHRAVASSRDALDALDEQLQQQRQRQVDSGLANGYSRDALDALDEQQARTANTSRNDGDTPAWAREPPRKIFFRPSL